MMDDYDVQMNTKLCRCEIYLSTSKYAANSQGLNMRLFCLRVIINGVQRGGILPLII